MSIKQLVAAAAALASIMGAPAALAHTRLEASSPQADSVVSPAPARLRLQFSDPLELPFSKIKLVDEQGAVIHPSRIEAEPAHPNTLVATVPALHAGAYRVQWSTVTRDGHKVKGEFGFRVK
jgi:methionine-rich copper-binding protein CopC